MITFININSKDKFFGVVQMHLRVDNKYYDGYELFEWNNKKLRLPKYYRKYRTNSAEIGCCLRKFRVPNLKALGGYPAGNIGLSFKHRGNQA